MLSTHLVSWEVVDKELKEDSVIQRIAMELKEGKQEHKGFSLVDNRVLYKGRTFIPRNSTVKSILLKEYHDSVLRGHSIKNLLEIGYGLVLGRNEARRSRARAELFSVSIAKGFTAGPCRFNATLKHSNEGLGGYIY